MIYLDNSATTKPYEDVVQTYTKVALDFFGNPSSLHTLGVEAEKLLNEARDRIAKLIDVKSDEIIFTSSGTEGNNLAIRGAIMARKNRGNHLITTAIEHPSVSGVFAQMEREGFTVTYLPVDQHGRVTVEQVKEAIRPETILVSIGHVNSEVGTVQPIEEIGTFLAGKPTIYFHVDHVQGLTKVPLSLKEAKIDLCTCSAHKFHGLKGTGFLYVRNGIQLAQHMIGGDQENGIRAGTENVAAIVAMARALRIALDKKEQHHQRLILLREHLIEKLIEIDGIEMNSPSDQVAPHIVNFSIPGMKPEVIVQSLTAKGIYISTKSACSSKLSEPSHVLVAMNVGKERANSGVRVSFSYDTTEEEINLLLEELKVLVPQLLKVVES